MAGTGLWRRAALAVLIAGILHPARAEPPATDEQFKQAIALIIAPISVVEALTAQCDTLSPKSRGSREAVLKAWRDANRIDTFQGAIAPIIARTPGSAASMSALHDKAAASAKAVVVGRPNDQRLRYRIDGYVLELSADGAVERHFIARFGDDKADDPHSLYLGGEMLWDRDKEDKPTKKK